MICPWCQHELVLRDYVENNAYLRPHERQGVANALCCGRPIRLQTRIMTNPVRVDTNEAVDDWGEAFGSVPTSEYPTTDVDGK